MTLEEALTPTQQKTYCERCGWMLTSDAHLRECGSEAPWFHPESAAFRGLAGAVVEAITPHTEADPAALLMNTCARFGAMVGRGAHTTVGTVLHPAAVFVVNVGRTSRSRKDTAAREVGHVFDQVEDRWDATHIVSGFGSGEAFIEHAAANPGEAILVFESELSRLLVAASRDGSSISSVLRSAWDYRRLEHRIRGSKREAEAVPVSMIANITMDELRHPRHGLRTEDILNGLGPRNLFTYVDRRKRLPSPIRVPDRVLTPLVRELRDTLNAARRRGVVERSAPAEELWRDLYSRMADDDEAGVVGALTARAEAQVLRLALIYALLDTSKAIDVTHLESAWEVWRYCRWTVQHVWVGSGTGDPDLDRIAAVLDTGERLNGRDLDRMFSGSRSTPDLRAKAVAAGIAIEEREQGERGGRPVVWLRAPEQPEQRNNHPRWWMRPTFLRSSGSSVGEAQLDGAPR